MNPAKITDPAYLIVGQGIAGTLLAYFLFQKNQPFKVIDKPLPCATSQIAAGLINPITGRRMVKSWRFDELSSHAKATYLGIGRILGIEIFHEKNILRALPTVFDENEWDRRSNFPENKDYFCEKAELGNYEGNVTSTVFGELKGSSKVNLPYLVSTFRRFLEYKNILFEEIFDFKEIGKNSEFIQYKGVNYKKIIFCEGSMAMHNPYFNYLPFSLSKGEMLLVRINGLNAEKILKNKIHIVPMGEDVYWIGSTNSFDYQDAMPTNEKKDNLRNTLSEILSLPFEILSHQAGIRPTISDKRPLLGIHPNHPNLAIFNGLGTKGASLGPLFAEQMVGYLLGATNLDAEVDISRF